MISDQFEVLVVPFPFVDAPVSKPRPALVLSTAAFNRDNAHSVLAMITTAAGTRWPSDQPIHNLAPTGLRAASNIRFKLFTLDNRIIQRLTADGPDRALAKYDGYIVTAPPQYA